jgi:hypothetical protein
MPLLSSKRRRNFFGRQQGREFRVANNFHRENCLPAFDFVAVRQHRVLNASAIQKRAVAALAVLNAAAARPALHCKVHARHKRVVRQSKLRALRRSSDGHRLASYEGNFLARERPRIYLQQYAHLFSIRFCFRDDSVPADSATRQMQRSFLAVASIYRILAEARHPSQKWSANTRTPGSALAQCERWANRFPQDCYRVTRAVCIVFAETQDPITEKLEQLRRLGRSKVELLLSGAFGAAGEVEGGGWVVGFDEEVFYWPEELIGFFG